MSEIVGIFQKLMETVRKCWKLSEIAENVGKCCRLRTKVAAYPAYHQTYNQGIAKLNGESYVVEMRKGEDLDR